MKKRAKKRKNGKWKMERKKKPNGKSMSFVWTSFAQSYLHVYICLLCHIVDLNKLHCAIISVTQKLLSLPIIQDNRETNELS